MLTRLLENSRKFLLRVFEHLTKFNILKSFKLFVQTFVEIIMQGNVTLVFFFAYKNIVLNKQKKLNRKVWGSRAFQLEEST